MPKAERVLGHLRLCTRQMRRDHFTATGAWPKAFVAHLEPLKPIAPDQFAPALRAEYENGGHNKLTTLIHCPPRTMLRICPEFLGQPNKPVPGRPKQPQPLPLSARPEPNWHARVNPVHMGPSRPRTQFVDSRAYGHSWQGLTRCC